MTSDNRKWQWKYEIDKSNCLDNDSDVCCLPHSRATARSRSAKTCQQSAKFNRQKAHTNFNRKRTSSLGNREFPRGNLQWANDKEQLQ